MSEIVTIERLSHEGRGIARVQGKAVFIEHVIPGEVVQITEPRKVQKIFEAQVEQIMQASPERVTPPCPVFENCGGCSLQHMSAEAQLAHKQQVLQENFQHFGHIAPEEWLAPLPSPSTGYRRKARLGVRYVRKKDQAFVGFRERNGRYLVDMDQCAVLDPRVGENIHALRALIASLEQREQIAQIEVAMSNDTVALVFRNLKPLPEQDLERLVAYGKQYNQWILLQPAGPNTVHRIWPMQGDTQLHYTLEDFDVTLAFSPLDFTQINHALNPSMISQAIRLLDPQPHETVLDAFCGIGNFSLPLARHFQSVLGVEGDAEMVRKATENARINGCSNAKFVMANLFEPLATQPFSGQTFDKILMDPPRAGAEALVKDIHHLKAKTIVYISCHPATLARDAGILVNEQGYTMTHAGVMDMFPHTSHVESIAVFHKTTSKK